MGGLFQAHAGGWDPHERVKEMAVDGVSGEMLYPSFAMNLFGLQEAALQEDENGRRSGQPVAGQLSDGLVERIPLPDLRRREGLTPDHPWAALARRWPGRSADCRPVPSNRARQKGAITNLHSARVLEVRIHFSTPMTDRTSMILQWVYRNDTEEQVSSGDVVAFDRAVTLEDKRILESCDADVPLADTDGEEMHMRTDYPGVVMRRMLAKLLADHGETEQRAGG